MNQGPLPGMGGLPAPLHDTADGRINFNSSLLGDVNPYAYGQPGYLSSQTAYLNIPHRIQKIVPYLFLPAENGQELFELTHPVDDGDICFVMRLNRKSEICRACNDRAMQRCGLGTAIDPMINLCTLNYLLAGLQLCTHGKHNAPHRKCWDALMHDLDARKYPGGQDTYTFHDIYHVVKNLITPFGVAHGSQRQGGQHEGKNSAVTWPVNYVTSLVLDGRDTDILNIWNFHDVDAGIDLVLRLKPMPIPHNGKYTLNHWPKGLVTRTFDDRIVQDKDNKSFASLNKHWFTSEIGQQLYDMGYTNEHRRNIATMLEETAESCQKVTHVWQLVPDVFSYECDLQFPAKYNKEQVQRICTELKPHFQLPFNFYYFDMDTNPYAWQEVGYWHITRPQVHCRKFGASEYYSNDMANNLRNGVLDGTFQPVFKQLHSKNKFNCNTAAIKEWTDSIKKLKELTIDLTGSDGMIDTGLLRRIVANVPPRPPPGFDGVGGAPQARTNSFFTPSKPLNTLSTSLSTPSKPPEPLPEPQPMQEEPVQPLIQEEPTPTLAEPHVFSVPKPTLKQKRQRKGLVSSVLGQDGSVTQELSRML